MWLPKLPDPVDSSARAELEQRWNRASRWVLVYTGLCAVLTAVVVAIVALQVMHAVDQLPVVGSQTRGPGRLDVVLPLGLVAGAWIGSVLMLRGRSLARPSRWLGMFFFSGLGIGLAVAACMQVGRISGAILPLVLVPACAVLIARRAERCVTSPLVAVLGASAIQVVTTARTTGSSWWERDTVALEQDSLVVSIHSGKDGQKKPEVKNIPLQEVRDVRGDTTRRKKRCGKDFRLRGTWPFLPEGVSCGCGPVRMTTPCLWMNRGNSRMWCAAGPTGQLGGELPVRGNRSYLFCLASPPRDRLEDQAGLHSEEKCRSGLSRQLHRPG